MVSLLPTALLVASLLAAGVSMQAVTKISESHFGKTREGVNVNIYTMTSKNGLEVRITNYGGILVSLKAPDRNGRLADVIDGFDDLNGYLNQGSYFGAIIGRYANRIGKARFTLNGVEYKLSVNNGENSLHGGKRGFDKTVWTPRKMADGGIELKYFSKDGEEGYPGDLNLTVTYRLTDANELRIDYRGTANKDTVLNLTNHAYFNLKGAGEGDILDHIVTIDADRFTPVDAGMIPTGELRPVIGTPFDFRRPTAIGARIEQNDEQLKLGKGYDHNWVLNSGGKSLALAARVEEASTGRILEVLTTEPGIQFYTANSLNGSVKGKGGKPYNRRYGFCLETQHFPDSPNKPNFPSVVLKSGQEYQSTTVYRLTTKK